MIDRQPRSGPRVFISAGEPSGDLHGAALIRALRVRYPRLVVEALGGPRMAAEGAVIRHRMEGLAAFGLVEVATKLGAHLRLLRAMTRDFRAHRYDLVVLIDYPGFHLRLAEAARRSGTRVLYYIAPQLWAWRPGRARRLASAVDRVAVVLPFEARFFGQMGIRADYVGHPLLDHADHPTRDEARGTLEISDDSRVLSLFPGSRSQEVRRLWPPFRDAALQLLAERRCDRVLVAARAGESYPDPGPLELVTDRTGELLAASDATIAKSGTTTLEAALTDTPMVVAYRVHPLTWRVFQRLRTVRWVSLVNLVAEREVVPELLQDDANPERLVTAVRPLLDPADPRTLAQREGLALVRERLGSPGASGRLVCLAAELIER